MKTSKTTKPESREEIRANYQSSEGSRNDLVLMCGEAGLPSAHIDSQVKQSCSFAQVAASWQLAMQARQKATTQQKYAYLLKKHILPHLGNCEVGSLSTNRISAFIREKLSCGRIGDSGKLSPSYVRSMAILIGSVLRFADKQNICFGSQIEIYKPALVRKEVEILSINEQLYLEECLLGEDTPTGMGIIVSLNTGLRLGEICALSWDDICWDDHTLTVRGTVVRLSGDVASGKAALRIDAPKTPTSLRQIPIPLKLWAPLRHLYRNSVGKYMLTGTDKFISPRTYEYRFHRSLEHYGIRAVNYHALRHTFATRCIEAGMDIKTLSELLGHSNVATTMNTYVHSSMERKRIQIEKVTALFEKCRAE